jgi:hypothetical protein
MVVNISDGVAGSGFDKCTIKDLAKVILRACIAGVEEVGVQRHVEEGCLTSTNLSVLEEGEGSVNSHLTVEFADIG